MYPVSPRANLRNERGFTLVEMLIVVAIIGVVASVAVAQVWRARVSANEASAISSLRAINTAQESYSAQCIGFAVVLTELGTAGTFLSPDLTGAAIVAKSGYKITVTASISGTPLPAPPAGCTAPETNYYAKAEPLTLGLTGTRAFATNGQGSIYYVRAAIAPAEATFPVSAAIQ